MKLAHFHPAIWPGGGPFGYLYGLRDSLVTHAPDAPIDIVAIAEHAHRHNLYARVAAGGARGWTRRLLMGTSARGLMRRRAWRRYMHQWQGMAIPSEVIRRLEGYRAVVFHEATVALGYLRARRKASGQKVFLHLHPPVDLAAEAADYLVEQYGLDTRASDLRRRAREIEARVYEDVDGLVVPCVEAVEDYFAGEPRLRASFRDRPFHEVPSGVLPLTSTTPPVEMRARLGVPPDQVLVLYFGRYTRHKGFDIYLDVARLASIEFPRRFRFFAAGSGPIRAPSIEGLTDVGWIRHGLGEYVAAADCVLTPSRHAFFDLALLEAMSLGKPVVTSARGGNRWLARMTKGVVLADGEDPNAYLRLLVELSDERRLAALGRQNHTVYEEQFSPGPFAGRHAAFARAVLAAGSVALP